MDYKHRHVSLIFFTLVLSLYACTAHSWMHKVDPGEMPELKSDQGLVVMAVDSGLPLQSVRLNKDGNTLGAGVMNNLDQGQTYQLYVAPVGNYAWHRISLSLSSYLDYYVGLRDEPEFKFEVSAGRITYAGDLVVRSPALINIQASMVNRGLAAIDWLQSQHPKLYAHYELVYSGYYPDPFPAFYKAEQARHPDAGPPGEVRLMPPPAPVALPIAPATMFRSSRIAGIDLSPDGNLLALHVHEKKDDWQIQLIDLVAGTSSVLATSAEPFFEIEWSGNNALLFSSNLNKIESVLRAVRWSDDADGKRKPMLLKLPAGGSLLDALADEPDAILYATRGKDGGLRVHRVDISSQRTIDSTSFNYKDRLNKGVKDDLWWLADARGNLRLAIVRHDGERLLTYVLDGKSTELMKLDDQEDFVPVGISSDATRVFAISDRGRAQRDLVAYDVNTRKIVRTLFTKPGVDVHAALFGQQRKPIGVSYYEDGHLVSVYFDDEQNRLSRSLAEAFPGRSIALAGRSRDGQRVILWVDAADKPPALYSLDVASRRVELLEEDMPWLQGIHFATTEIVRFQNDEDLPIEAFLTIPAGSGKKPLIVFPHGGPIGIADTLRFDREVQFLASLGYAVLRVNYRGSDGYGREFRDAGKHSFGTRIEDDIDAATRLVLAKYPLDETRICAVGSSYGGYSAMVMAIRWPERFRCVISMSGVADRILFFTASDGGRSATGRQALERIIGNPNTDATEMRATSPLYHYDQIRTPLMIVHGIEDRRVDFEHSRRMLRMLDMSGHIPVGLLFAEEGHGFSKPENLESLWNGVAGFLQKYLDDPQDSDQPEASKQ